MEMRTAHQSDFEDICKLIKTKEELFLVYPKGKFPFTVEQLNELSQTRKDLTIVSDKSKIVGFANFYNFTPHQSAFIGNVIIDKEYRGQHLGKKLIQYMLERAKQKHRLSEVKISVFNSNSKALLLYANLGFTPYAIEERQTDSEKRVALIHMELKTGNC